MSEEEEQEVEFYNFPKTASVNIYNSVIYSGHWTTQIYLKKSGFVEILTDNLSFQVVQGAHENDLLLLFPEILEFLLNGDNRS